MRNPETLTTVKLDWLQLSCYKVSIFEGLCELDLEVVLKGFQTRHFRKVEEIFMNHKRIATLVSEPHSSVLRDNFCIIKFDNQFLYNDGLWQSYKQVLKQLGLVFNNITRMDICTDFHSFSNNLNPSNFIKRFLDGKYLKSGKSKFKIMGETGKKIELDYLRFGSGSSAVSSYLYNKSKEMQQAKFKPWIFESWEKDNLNTNENVWRLEFSINSGCKDLVKFEDGEVFSIKDEQLLNKDRIQELFFVLARKYFQFFINQGKSKIARNKELKLFKQSGSNAKFIYKEVSEDSSRADKIFIKKLLALNDELRGNNPELGIKSSELVNYFVDSRKSQSWMMRNQLQEDIHKFKSNYQA